MRGEKDQSLWERVWNGAWKQHGAIARWQLVRLGLSPKAIERALASGRLHRAEWRGVYAVGRPELSEYGRLMGAVLSLGPGAVLSHQTAAWLWRIRERPGGREIHLSVPAVGQRRKRRGMVVHRRALRTRDVTRQRGIPVTSPIRTILDLAPTSDRHRVERDIDEAVARNLVKLETLRAEVEAAKGLPGAPLLRAILDRDSFVLTDSELERLFLPIAYRAGLPKPRTQAVVNGYRVDFYWPELRLIVEVDGLRYHRTPQAQARDLRRDQAHAAAGDECCRFSYAQVAKEGDYVEGVLRRLRPPPARTPGRPRAA